MNWKIKILDGIVLIISMFVGLVMLPVIIQASLELDLNMENDNKEIKKQKYVSAKQILQERYANGEINSLEYLERMVRL